MIIPVRKKSVAIRSGANQAKSTERVFVRERKKHNQTNETIGTHKTERNGMEWHGTEVSIVV